MARRNDKRNNRRNRQRNNTPELPPFAQMLFGAIVAPDIHAEGISNQDVTNINNGKASLTKCTIPTNGTAVELPIPDNLQVFISEDGKPMIRKMIEGDMNKTPDAVESKPITYDDICNELFLYKKTYWLGCCRINTVISGHNNYNNINNSTSCAQVKRLVAFNKLQNIAKYLNGDWKPDFDGNHKIWNICKVGDTFIALYTTTLNKASVYFKNEGLAKEAIEIMGKNSLNDLFSTDW